MRPLLAVALLIAPVLAGCLDETAPAPAQEPTLEGRFVYRDGPAVFLLTLTRDGKARLDAEGPGGRASFEGTYDLRNRTLTLDGKTAPFSMEGEDVLLFGPERYERVKTDDGARSPATGTSGGRRVEGKFVYRSSQRHYAYILRADGTWEGAGSYSSGSYSESWEGEGRYSFEDGALYYTDGRVEPLAYIDENNLEIVGYVHTRTA